MCKKSICTKLKFTIVFFIWIWFVSNCNKLRIDIKALFSEFTDRLQAEVR